MRGALTPALLLGCAVAVLSAPAPAQIVGGAWDGDYVVTGEFYSQRIGYSVAGVGDQNSDGRDDFAVASRNYFGAGRVLVYSGFDGSLLRVLADSSATIPMFVSVAAAGDVDGDGVGDVVAGSPDTILPGQTNVGSMLVFSGATGSLLLRMYGETFHSLGETVAGAGDVDGDGHADLISGGPYAYGLGGLNRGITRVFSGATGLELYRFVGAHDHDLVGWSICGVGDWNGDGRDDFAYAANGMDVGLMELAGTVFVHSGADGSLLRRFDGELSYQRFGWDLDAADVDADGILDLVVGDPLADLPGPLGAGRVSVYSGNTGQLILRVYGERRGDEFGHSVARAGNLDGDGHDDLVVGSPEADPRRLYRAGAVHLISGRTGAVLHAEYGVEIEQQLGLRVGSAGDVDGDGVDHVLIGVPGEDRHGIGDTGAVFVGGFQTFLTPSAESVSIAAGGRIIFDIHFPAEAGGAVYQFLVSRTGTGPTPRFGLQVPLTPDGFFYRASDRDYPAAATGFAGVLSANGSAGAALLVPPGSVSAAMIGRQIWFAAVARDWTGAGLYSSVARGLRFEP